MELVFPMKAEFKDKTAIITGGSQGIGRGMALALASRGAKVMICSRTKSDLEAVETEIKKLNGQCESRVVDVTDYEGVQAFVGDVVNRHGGVDILITSAGVYGPIGFLEHNDVDEWNKTIEINLVGTVNAVRCVVPCMKTKKGGKIITLCGGGIGGTGTNPFFSAYTASKAAIAGFTEAMAKELKEYNIQINSISPGAVNTRFLDIVLDAGDRAGRDFLEKSKKQKITGGTPLEKITNLALFLASSASNHVTGKLLSAVWDDIDALRADKDGLSRTSMYTLRRIDGVMFLEKRNDGDNT